MTKLLTGIVVANQTPKTIIVDVHKRFQHPRFKKVMNIHKRFKVHVPNGTVNIGEVVKIQETRPISKDKHFILVSGKEVQKTKESVKTTQADSTVAAPKKEKKTAVKKAAPKAVKKATRKAAIKAKKS